MPELPEVETVVRDLRPMLVGRRLSAVRRSPHPLRVRWSPEWEPRLLSRSVRGIRRRGKWILIDLEPDHLLVVHLGMTGQLTVVPAGDPLADHVHLQFDLDNGEFQLRYRDIRRFGSAVLYADEQAWTTARDEDLGPEPFDLKPGPFRESLSRTERCLKAILLDQRVVAGVGNIYADESLFMARLDPRGRGCDRTPRQAERLRKAIVAVLGKAIDSRGSTIRDYVGGSGLKGGYQHELAVYGRTGQPCPRCGQPVECIRLAGRSTHWCPRCQRS